MIARELQDYLTTLDPNTKIYFENDFGFFPIEDNNLKVSILAPYAEDIGCMWVQKATSDNDEFKFNALVISTQRG